MILQKKRGIFPLLGLVVLMLCAAMLTGCMHHYERYASPPQNPDRADREQNPDRNNREQNPDRYGYYQTRDVEDNPSDNAAIRHERRGHNRWRP